MLLAAGNPKPVLCDYLEGGRGRRTGWLQRKKTYSYLWLIHADVCQKPPQYYKVTILQLKIKYKFLKKKMQF